MKTYLPVVLAVASAHAWAQAPHTIEHVLVTAPLQKQEAETALPVTALDREALSRIAGATIGDTLGDMPGIANASFGPGVGQPVIRGQQGPRVSVLQNGTSSADAANVSADHAVAVEALLADSVEVLRGPSTLLYGAGAIGGVVNVIDNRIPRRPIEGVEGGVELRHDGASDMDTSLIRLDGGSGAFAWHVDALYRDWNDLDIPGAARREVDAHDDEHEDHGADQHAEDEAHVEEETTDGYVGNTGGRTKQLTTGGSYHFDGGFVGLAVSRLENTYGIPSGAHAGHDHGDHEDEEHEDVEQAEDGEVYEEHGAEDGHGDGDILLDVEQTRYDLAMELDNPLPGFATARSRLTYTDYEHAEIEAGGEIGTLYSNETWEGWLEMVHNPVGQLHGALGLQARRGTFSALGEEAFIPRTRSRDIGIFLVEDYHWESWTLEGGLRLDRDRRDPDAATAGEQSFTSVSASVSALWNQTDALQWRLSLARSERAPSIEELFSNVDNSGPESWVEHAATASIELGDPDLDTEVSRNLDLALHWHGATSELEITAFYNDFADYITLMNTGLQVGEVPVLSYHQEGARFHGVEISGSLELGSLAGGVVQAGLTADLIRGELDSGEDIPRLPPRRLGGQLSWAGERLELWARVLDASAQKRAGLNEAQTPGYTRWDIGADYRLPLGDKELVLFVAGHNLGDEEIRLSTSFLRDVAPEAGRSVEAGLRLHF